MIRKAAFALGLCGVVVTSISAQRLPLTEPEEVGLSSERLQRIGEVFQDYVDEGRIAGAVGMVLRHGKLAYVDAWGMRDMAADDAMGRGRHLQNLLHDEAGRQRRRDGTLRGGALLPQ